jgi:aminopeptidase N
VWPQRLRLLEARGLSGRIEASLDLNGAEAAFPRWAAGGPIRWVLPNGSGLEYGRFELDALAVEALLEDLPNVPNPLLRGTGWLIVVDALLEGQLRPERVLDGLLAGLETEEVEQLVGLLIGQTSDLFWSFLTPEQRSARAAEVEAAMWAGFARAESISGRATWFQGWRSVVTSDAGVERLRAIWEGTEEPEGLPLAVADRTALAEALAVRGVPDAEAILNAQEARIDNPDRLERLRFIRPALSGDPEVRSAFFAQLADVEMRAREPWVLDAVAHLNHPLRQESARAFIRPGLELVHEIQRTGDIFFPARWLGALLDGHQTPEAADIVVQFLNESRELPLRLRGKVLQEADGVVRAARITFDHDAEMPGPPAFARTN